MEIERFASFMKKKIPAIDYGLYVRSKREENRTKE